MSYNTLMASGSQAEEVQPPSIWSTALDPVEEGAMALFQQSILEVLTMAFHDEVFACKRACQRPVPVFRRRVRHRAYPEALTSRYSDRGKVGQ